LEADVSERRTATEASLDPVELARFGELAGRWWDPGGPLAPLHRLNPLRLAYIRDRLCLRFGRDAHGPRPLAGLRVLDIGCGAGLLAEPLARLGADVTGIDPSPETVETAALHARESGLAITYAATTVEALAASGETFDAVLALEVVEHVAEVSAFLEACCACVRPGGVLVLATIGRTPRSWLEAIVAAEYLLGWLPRGTHRWSRFLKPSELMRELRRHDMRLDDLTGVTWDPASGGFRLIPEVDVNYMLAAARA
jgi:2-polyprenyl-6-hydroxyphenyl methylase / 3-demethylubiquinone-9 3-methyltransferase